MSLWGAAAIMALAAQQQRAATLDRLRGAMLRVDGEAVPCARGFGPTATLRDGVLSPREIAGRRCWTFGGGQTVVLVQRGAEDVTGRSFSELGDELKPLGAAAAIVIDSPGGNGGTLRPAGQGDIAVVGVAADAGPALLAAERISLAVTEVLPPAAVLAALSDYGGDEAICEAGLHTLHHASLARVRHAEAGTAVAKATVDTMRGHNENSRVRRYGCFILGTLSYQNYVGNQVMPAISVVLDAMEAGEADDRVVAYGCRALTHLIKQANKMAGNWLDVEGRIFEQATLARRRYPGDSGVMEWSGRTLTRLEAANEDGEEAEGGEAPAAAAAGLGVGALRAQTFNEATLMRSGAVGGAGAAAAGEGGSLLDGAGSLRSASFKA